MPLRGLAGANGSGGMLMRYQATQPWRAFVKHAMAVIISTTLWWSGGMAIAAAATSADRTFVAKVSQGGMFEVEAGKLATTKASAVDVSDFATSEVHDHTLVGDKLKAIATSE